MSKLALPHFLELVDEYTDKMSKENLSLFIHNIARKYPEDKRQFFIDELICHCSSSFNVSDEIDEQEQEKKEVIEQVNNIILKLQKINNGEFSLHSELNEEWNDWYDSAEDEYDFKDPSKLLNDIAKAFSLIDTCIEKELLEEGYKICELLSSLNVPTDGEYYEYHGEGLCINDLDFYKLLSIDFSNFYTSYLYLVYMKLSGIDRLEKMYSIFTDSYYHQITLETVVQKGNKDLPDFNEFLSLWIEYLANQKDSQVSRLLRDAYVFVNEDMELLIARKFVNNHPELYLSILNKKTEIAEYDNALSIGLEAIDLVTTNPKIKAKIALCTSVSAFKLGKQDVREKCWIEAYKSDPNILNYLRVKFITKKPEQYNDVILSKIQEMKNSSLDGEATIALCIMLFFEKKFTDMETFAKLTPDNIGPYCDEVVILCLNLMMLLLYRGEKFSRGLLPTVDKVHRKMGFDQDLFYMEETEAMIAKSENNYIKDGFNSTIVFTLLFTNWKKSFSVPENYNFYWLEKIKNWIQNSVAKVMKDNHRSRYDECAQYIAVYGEILESQGTVDGKNKFMNEYRDEYPRRTSFLRSLYYLGMRK